MRKSTAATFVLLLSPWAAGCGTAPGVNDPGVTPCKGTSCEDEPPPESVCVEHVAAGVLDDGCGVFVAGAYGFGDDRNPGTKAKPVFTVEYAVELARAGRGRVFLCNDGFVVEQIRVPSGVDLLGGFHCRKWERDPLRPFTLFNPERVFGPLVIVEPSAPGDTGAADGVSTLADLHVPSWGPVGVLAQSNTAVEILRSEISANGGGGNRHGERWPTRQPDGPDGMFGGDACSAAVVAGGPAPVNQCESALTSVGGKGGDGLPDSAEDGADGEPADAPPSGRGGSAEQDNTSSCYPGSQGGPGAPGTQGAPGKGIGRLTETGWEGDTGGEGTWGTPGQGGGGGGGRRGGLARCGAASKGGPGGGSGGAGGCGGRGGRGGGNGQPSIGVLALHARVTVRETKITADFGGKGGDGGPPQDGGRGGRGAPGGTLGNELAACFGGEGGQGGPGGYGGPGRGGDSIGIAYLDEDQLTLEGVTIGTGQPGKGGTSWNHDGSMTVGESGEAHETFRFPQ